MPPVIFCISRRTSSGARERSRTWVAPRDFSRDALCGDAVVMMGECPDSFASWMAARSQVDATSCSIEKTYRTVRRRMRRRGSGRASRRTSLSPLAPTERASSQIWRPGGAPEPGRDGSETERNRRRLVEGNVVRNLRGLVSHDIEEHIATTMQDNAYLRGPFRRDEAVLLICGVRIGEVALEEAAKRISTGRIFLVTRSEQVLGAVVDWSGMLVARRLSSAPRRGTDMRKWSIDGQTDTLRSAPPIEAYGAMHRVTSLLFDDYLQNDSVNNSNQGETDLLAGCSSAI